MPGPQNTKRRRKAQLRVQKKKAAGQRTTQDRPPTPPATDHSQSPPLTSTPVEIQLGLQLLTPAPSEPHVDSFSVEYYTAASEYDWEPAIPDKPFIYDPGNGPRVRDMRAFLNSKFFAQPPAWDSPLCAEFAQEEVLEMIRTALPEEMALILWYNKSRATSRICPACQRLYRLGDNLPEHMSVPLDPEDDFDDDSRSPRRTQPSSPRLMREQEISGLCSPVCFILAAFNYPGAIQSAWGRMGDEMDEESWGLLNGPGEGYLSDTTTNSALSQGLSMLVKMTRLYDLGLAQLCFSEDEFDD